MAVDEGHNILEMSTSAGRKAKVLFRDTVRCCFLLGGLVLGCDTLSLSLSTLTISFLLILLFLNPVSPGLGLCRYRLFFSAQSFLLQHALPSGLFLGSYLLGGCSSSGSINSIVLISKTQLFQQPLALLLSLVPLALVPRIATAEEDARVAPLGCDPHGHEQKSKGPHDGEQQRPRGRRLPPTSRHVIGYLGRDVGDLIQILRHRLLHVVEGAGLLPQRGVHPQRGRLHLRRHLGDLRFEHLGLLSLDLLVLFVGGSAVGYGIAVVMLFGTCLTMRWLRLLLLLLLIVAIITQTERIIIGGIAMHVVYVSISSIVILLLGRQEQLVDYISLESVTLVITIARTICTLPPPGLEQILPDQPTDLLRLGRQRLDQPVLPAALVEVLPPRPLQLVVVGAPPLPLGQYGEVVEVVGPALPRLGDGVVQMRQQRLGEGEPIGQDVRRQETLLHRFASGGRGGSGRSHGMEEAAQVKGPTAEGRAC